MSSIRLSDNLSDQLQQVIELINASYSVISPTNIRQSFNCGAVTVYLEEGVLQSKDDENKTNSVYNFEESLEKYKIHRESILNEPKKYRKSLNITTKYR